MTQPEWGAGACESCRTAVLRGCQTPPLVRLGAGEGPIFLYRCADCAAYWEENLREAHVVTEDSARLSFPQAFPLAPPA